MARGFGASGVGSTDKIEVANYARMNGLKRFTFSIWTYRTGNGGGGTGRCMQKSTSNEGLLQLMNDNSQDGWSILANRWSGTAGSWQFDRPPTNEWHHIAVTYDYGSLSNEPKLYEDGVEVALKGTFASPTGTDTGTDTRVLNISNTNSNVRVWDGFLAEVALFNEFLSLKQIKRSASGVTPDDIEGDLVAYIDLYKPPPPFINPIGTANPGTIAAGTVFSVDHPPKVEAYRLNRRNHLTYRPVPIRKRFGVIEKTFTDSKPMFGEVSASNYKSHQRYKGCVGHWMMNEGAGISTRDISGHGNHSILTAMTIPDDWVIGQFGKALSSTGGNAAMIAPWPAAIEFEAGDSRSYSLWYKPIQNAPSGFARLLGWGASGSGFDLGGTDAPTVDRVVWFDGAWHSGNADLDLTRKVWQHIALTFDGATVKIYINGIEKESTSSTGQEGKTECVIGQRQGSTTAGCNGHFDEVRIYNRALRPAEVWSLYQDPYLEFKQEIPFAIPPFRPQAVVLDWK